MAWASKVDQYQGSYSRFMHMHPETVELILITDGAGDFFIDNRTYPVKRGDLVIYNSLVVHDEFLEKANSSSAHSLLCCGIRNIVKRGMRPNTLIPDGAVPIFPLYHHYGNVSMLMNLIFTMLNSAAEKRNSMAQSLTQVLLDYINGNILVTIDDSVDPQSDTLPASIKNFIDQHYHEPILLGTLARKFRVSPYYISHEFKRAYGYSPMDYLIKRRLGEAQILLTTAEGKAMENITEIAYRVGFANLSHFQNYFKKRCGGKTPGQFRREYLMENE
ncbi:AraC family transcriptional regulator [Brenneria izadpanahii]|uniref:AraC family transcriptional regulator n=1 Tax=Brenneria izadpanahii TaxID=2722756 RepID=A0ABX7V514_9GAMM|nr:AraC family transcriptional regulator [Brenneria izadpanahii]